MSAPGAARAESPPPPELLDLFDAFTRAAKAAVEALTAASASTVRVDGMEMFILEEGRTFGLGLGVDGHLWQVVMESEFVDRWATRRPIDLNWTGGPQPLPHPLGPT